MFESKIPVKHIDLSVILESFPANSIAKLGLHWKKTTYGPEIFGCLVVNDRSHKCLTASGGSTDSLSCLELR